MTGVVETGDLRDQRQSLVERGIDPNFDGFSFGVVSEAFKTNKGVGFFVPSSTHQFEAVGDERPNVITPVPAPICQLVLRSDTGDWFVATGVYYKPVHSIDGNLFRDSDGGIWRLLTK